MEKKKKLCQNCQENLIPADESDDFVCDECYEEISRGMDEGMFTMDHNSKS